jgi:hypothetical protein
MYRKVFIVGLGGSGGKTLRFLRRDLLRWLEQYGWTEVPKGWQFLQIDSPTIPDGQNVKVPMLPDDQYLGLVSAGVQFSNIASQLDGNPMVTDELAGWRVSPAGLGVSVTIGAGQYRAIGRTLALAYLPQIRKEITKALASLSLPQARSELNSLYQDVHGTTPVGQDGDPIVVVISSLAGGSGAGLINDVCDIIREKESWGKPIGVLYTPEVFESILSGAKNGTQPNSLAAISEILNGYWWHGGGDGGSASLVPMKASAVMTNAGAASSINKTGPEYPFLVGARNSAGVTYTSDNQLFETVGAALLSWLNDEAVQSSLVAYGIGNWVAGAMSNQPTADILVNRGSTAINEPGAPAFSALGFSRVSVGTKYFETYASQLLAKDSISHVLAYHLQSDEAQQVISRTPTNQINVAAVVEEIAENHYVTFMRRAQLDEKGPTNNQVVDSLKPDWGPIFDECLQTALSSLSAVAGNLSAKDWSAQIRAAVEVAAEEFARQMQPRVEKLVENWVEARPDEILAIVEEFVASKGLKVTQQILVRVGAELAHVHESVVADLAAEEQAFLEESYETRWSQTIESYLTFGGKVPAGHQSISTACTEAMYQAICGTWARINRVAQDLISEFEKDFLSPLAQKLGDAYSMLEGEFQEECSDWPSWSIEAKTHHGVLSSEATPAKSEWTLIHPDEFGRVFDEVLAQSKPGLAPVDSRADTRVDVISGRFIRQLALTSPQDAHKNKHLHLLSISGKWWPSSYVLPNSSKNKSQTSFSHTSDVESMVGRARAWLWSSGTAFEDLLKSTLVTYTTPNAVMGKNPFVTTADYENRQKALVAALDQALQASDPLVGIDSAVMAKLYSNAAPQVHTTYSKIPFKGHPLEKKVSGMLQQILGDANAVEALLDANATTDHIDIISWFKGPYPIFVFDSLLRPIAENWAMKAGKAASADRKNFWTRRRARGLTEFIPAPQEHIVCMLRGWFTARMLGLVQVDTVDNENRVHIVPPRGVNSNPLAFPAHLLSPSGKWGDIPAAILESLGLAYVEVCRSGNLSSLDPYIALREYGREGSGTDDQLWRYGDASHLIRDWIQSGTFSLESGGKGFTPPIIALDGESTPEARKAAVLALLNDGLRQKYATEKAEYDVAAQRNPNILSLPPLWPSMWPQVDLSLNQLIQAVEGIETTATNSHDW